MGQKTILLTILQLIGVTQGICHSYQSKSGMIRCFLGWSLKAAGDVVIGEDEIDKWGEIGYV